VGPDASAQCFPPGITVSFLITSGGSGGRRLLASNYYLDGERHPISACATPERSSMRELDVIDLPDGRRGTVVYISSDHAMLIVEVGADLIDYVFDENGLKVIGRMTVV
jgi:hypothetical protein